MPRRVSFIGAGNVATRMRRRLEQLGWETVRVCSRSGEPVSELDPQKADLVIVAVSDDAIPGVLAEVGEAGDALWVHTSGSVGLDAFDAAKFPRRGVLYPLQTLRKDVDVDWSRVPIFIEGDDPLLGEVAREMSPTVAPLDSASRRRLHAAAVMGCNMAMYLWSLSERTMADAGLDFALLEPLLRLTLERAISPGPSASITGPARRGDLGTIAKHIAALPPEVADTYRTISRKMLREYHPEIDQSLLP